MEYITNLEIKMSTRNTNEYLILEETLEEIELKSELQDCTIESHNYPKQIVSTNSKQHLRVVIANAFEGEMQVQEFD